MVEERRLPAVSLLTLPESGLIRLEVLSDYLGAGDARRFRESLQRRNPGCVKHVARGVWLVDLGALKGGL